MSRPDIQEVLDGVARLWALRSTCSRLNVGAVIHTEAGVTIGTGYNGTLAGSDHCNHEVQPDEPCVYAVHAEQNAIAFAARRGIATEGAWMTVTHAPCVNCAKIVVQAGIKRVRFLREYRSSDGVVLLVNAGVHVVGPNE